MKKFRIWQLRGGVLHTIFIKADKCGIDADGTELRFYGSSGECVAYTDIFDGWALEDSVHSSQVDAPL